MLVYREEIDQGHQKPSEVDLEDLDQDLNQELDQELHLDQVFTYLYFYFQYFLLITKTKFINPELSLSKFIL